MIKTSVVLRPMQLGDISGAMRLSAAEGWNQSEKDWKFLIENPQNICMLAISDEKIIGTTTAINYSNQVAWIGMVLVDAEYRGKGISKLLLENIFTKAGFIKSLKLDATAAGQQVYKKFGFKDEYFIARMTNTSMKNLPAADGYDLLPEPVQLKHIDEMVALDKAVFGAERKQLIEYLIRENPGKAWIIKHDNRITGFALGRKGNKYHHIGPVTASSFIDAKILITKALKELANKPVLSDVLCDKEELINWFNSIGFIKQRQFVRMYKNENPFPGMRDNNYLISGPEFG